MIQSYPWYLSDWRESETRIKLSLAERGLYRELIDYCYLEGSLPSEPIQLARLAGCSISEFRRSWPKIEPLFQRDNGRFRHAKVDEVRLKLEAYHKQKSHAGSVSGRTRRERALNGRSEIVRTDVEPSPSPSPTPSPSPAPYPFPAHARTFELPSDCSIPVNRNGQFTLDSQEVWKWFCETYPGELKSDWDAQIFTSVMEGFEDILLLKTNLPKWMTSRKWQEGFAPTAENFLKKRQFKVGPPAQPKTKAELRAEEIEKMEFTA